jgi:SAM-dependent MidA family methyltransferase
VPTDAPLREVLGKLLETGDLPFRDFVELALYHPQFGYYRQAESPIGKTRDFVTSPALSPVFAFALSGLVREFVGRGGYEMSTVVDIGCGDGALIHSLYGAMDAEARSHVRFYGVDRSLERVRSADYGVAFVETLDAVPRDGAHLLIANELFDALPFARLVHRGEHLHELWVSEHDGELDWTEHEAPGPYEDYFAEHGIELEDGQFADVSLEWGAYYTDLCRFLTRGMIVTFDYGFTARQLFHPRIRRFGTAASYSKQRVTRDLLAAPGRHDITAHINFSDLIRAGEQASLTTLFFDRQAKFLLALGATEHELFTPVTEVQIESTAVGLDLLQRREDARRLVLPDGIGEEIRVLVQSRGLPQTDWAFQRPLF